MSFVKKALIGYGILNTVTFVLVTRLLEKHGFSRKDYFRILLKGPKDSTEAKKIFALDLKTTFGKTENWKEKVGQDILNFYVKQMQAACERHGYICGFTWGV